MAVGRQMTREGFETLLLEVRDGAQAAFSDFADKGIAEGAQRDPKIKDARAVWRSAEFALAMLDPGKFVPNREAVEEATELLDRLVETKDTGGEG
jgi:hypothetical protein